MEKRLIRIIAVLALLTGITLGENSFERNCVKCHQELPASLQEMLMNYIQVYSGEKNTKAALFHFMRYPHQDTSVMSEMFLQSYPVKAPLRISDEELRDAIDVYWKKYRVIGRLR